MKTEFDKWWRKNSLRISVEDDHLQRMHDLFKAAWDASQSIAYADGYLYGQAAGREDQDDVFQGQTEYEQREANNRSEDNGSSTADFLMHKD